MSELIGAGESGWWIPGESGSALHQYLPLKLLSENPIGSSYLKVFRHLVREKRRRDEEDKEDEEDEEEDDEDEDKNENEDEEKWSGNNDNLKMYLRKYGY